MVCAAAWDAKIASHAYARSLCGSSILTCLTYARSCSLWKERCMLTCSDSRTLLHQTATTRVALKTLVSSTAATIADDVVASSATTTPRTTYHLTSTRGSIPRVSVIGHAIHAGMTTALGSLLELAAAIASIQGTAQFLELPTFHYLVDVASMTASRLLPVSRKVYQEIGIGALFEILNNNSLLQMHQDASTKTARRRP
jgi:hypothetical protein